MDIRPAVCAIVALTLTACGSQGKPAPDATASPASSTSSAVATSSVAPVPTRPAAAPAKGDKPTREFVIGKWGTDGDCALAIDLRADGSSDGPFGNWTYNDGVISFPEEPDFKVNVTVIDDKTMQSTNASSPKTSRMTRCP